MNTLLRRCILAGASLGIVAVAAPVAAGTNAPIAQTGGMTVTVPLLGAQVGVTIQLDKVTGNLTSVELSPNTDATATKVTPSKVRFDYSNGETRVGVNAKKDQLAMRVSSGKLSDLVGKGSWQADVFGAGTTSHVDYEIKESSPDVPALTIASPVSTTGGVTAGTPNVSASQNDEGGAWAWGRVNFTKDGYSKTLTIAVTAWNDDDHQRASLSISLRGRDVQSLPLAQLQGAHTWTGGLCDGTALSINYTVSPTGDLAFVSATPAGATSNVSHDDHSLTVSWADKGSVQLRIRVGDSTENSSVIAKVHNDHQNCKDNPATPPSVNTPVSTTVKSVDNRDDHRGDGSGDHHQSDGQKGSSSSSSRSSSSTATTLEQK